MVVLLAVMAAPASAAVIHAPANGATAEMRTPLLFDWAWDDDEYATQGIVFTQVANPSDPIWTWGPGEANTNPGRIVVSDRYGPFLDSHATISFDNAKFVPGTWYWRLCNKSIYGEDDKCGLDAEVRSLVLTPPAICNDGIDNDLDGDTDWALDDGCGGDRNGATEGPLPQCADGLDNDGDGGLDLADRECKRRTDKLEAPDPLPRLFPGPAKAYVRSALRQELAARTATARSSASVAVAASRARG